LGTKRKGSPLDEENVDTPQGCRQSWVRNEEREGRKKGISDVSGQGGRFDRGRKREEIRMALMRKKKGTGGGK